MRMLRDVQVEHRGQFAFFIDMVLTASRPLSLLSVYFAETPEISKIVDAPLKRYPYDKAQQLYQLMESRLRSRCAGLLECRFGMFKAEESPEPETLSRFC
jgi:hypothetical protein